MEENIFMSKMEFNSSSLLKIQIRGKVGDFLDLLDVAQHEIHMNHNDDKNSVLALQQILPDAFKEIPEWTVKYRKVAKKEFDSSDFDDVARKRNLSEKPSGQSEFCVIHTCATSGKKEAHQKISEQGKVIPNQLIQLNERVFRIDGSNTDDIERQNVSHPFVNLHPNSTFSFIWSEE
jgi:hypothetical protein